MLPELRHVAQDFLKLAGAPVIPGILHPAHHLAHHLLEAGPLPRVQGVLELAYFINVGHAAFKPAAHIENFKVRDETAAVPEKFCHILDGKAGCAENHAEAGVHLGKLAHKLVGRQLQKAGKLVPVVGQHHARQLGMHIWIQPFILHHAGSEVFKTRFLGKIFLAGFGSLRLDLDDLLVDHGLEMAHEAFGKPREIGVPPAHKIQKSIGSERRDIQAVELLVLRTQNIVPHGETAQDEITLPVDDLAPAHGQGVHLGRSQELKKILVRRESSGNPQNTDELIPVRNPELETDTDLDADNGRGGEHFPGCLYGHAVVVHDGERPEALDPGVHDEMGRTFAALGIHVIDMVVKSQLIPRLRHFRKKVTVQQAAYHPGRTLRRGPEIMGQLELALLIPMRAHHALHNLHEDARRVAAQHRMRAVQNFVIKDSQSKQTIPRLAASAFEIAQQVHHGIGHAGNRRIHQFLYAMRVKIRVRKTLG